MSLSVGSLFSGIGGLDLGLERAGMEIAFQVEVDPWCRRVLEKHWPGVRRWDDVRTFPPGPAEEWRCDVLAGGFPCTDISRAGKRKGIDGEQSGLWTEFARIIRHLRPRYVLLENVSDLLVRGFDRVLGDLAEIGMYAEWECIPATAVGSPQRRERLFVVAYPHSERRQAGHVFSGKVDVGTVPQAWELGRLCRLERGASQRVWLVPDGGVHRVADGFSPQLDRLRGLGNAVVPHVAQFIGERILEFHASHPHSGGVPC